MRRALVSMLRKPLKGVGVDMAMPMSAQSRGRLLHPLVRDGGRLRQATWEEALGRAVEGLTRVKDQYGSDAFGCFSCSKSSNELDYLAQKFVRTAIGTNNIDSCNRT